MKTINIPHVVTSVALAGFLFCTGGVVALSAGAHEKPSICHPVNGKGETKTGWDIISPNKASAHMDEHGTADLSDDTGKHVSKDGRTDVYAVNGVCPGSPTETTTGGTPSTSTTTSTSSTASTTSHPSTTTHPSTTSTTSSTPPTETTTSTTSTVPPTKPPITKHPTSSSSTTRPPRTSTTTSSTSSTSGTSSSTTTAPPSSSKPPRDRTPQPVSSASVVQRTPDRLAYTGVGQAMWITFLLALILLITGVFLIRSTNRKH